MDISLPYKNLKLDGNGVTGINGNFIYLEQQLRGHPAGWGDLSISVNVVNVPTEDPPSWTPYRGGLVLAFSDQAIEGNEEQVYFECQMPNSWREGSAIYPLIHWTPSANETEKVVRWGLSYSWANVGDSYPDATVIYANSESFTDKSNEHKRTSFAPIDGSGKKISSVMLCRMFRNSSNAADTFTGSAYVTDINFHYQIDRVGSRAELTK